MTFRLWIISGVLVAAVTGAAFTAAAQVMPDPRQIAGIPLPVADVPAGTVTVRVIRGSLANNVAGQLVELFVDGSREARQAKTAESGRAEFSGLQPGRRVRAIAVVAGERLESREFPVPSTGGIRVLLVARDPEADTQAAAGTPAAGQAQAGTVVLGEQSRFVFELGDEAVNVFNILQIVNTTGLPVETREPIVFEAPANSGPVSVLNGSTPQAKAEGKRVHVAGPFPSGPTIVQFAYTVPYSGSSLTIEQRMPAALNQVTMLAQKTGNMGVTSAQIAERREMTARGETYIVGQGPGVKAGDVVSFSFTGLPHAARWPRYLALSVAVMILAAGAWSSVRPARAGTSRGDLESRRERLLAELTTIEHQHRTGAMDATRHASRRRELVAELESIYAVLDN